MIRIAFVIDTIESPTAGTERQLLLLLKHLDRRRFLPSLYVLRSSPWLEREFALCDLQVVGISSYKRAGAYLRLRRFARRLAASGIDIVQTHFRDSTIAGVISARLAGIGTVISTRRNQGYWHTRGELTLAKALNRWVTLVLANSESTKRWAMATEGVPEDRIRVIHNGIDLDEHRALDSRTRAQYRELLGLPDGSIAVGMVANLRPIKGIEVFLSAAAQAARQVPEARFIIAGEGEERASLEAYAARLGLAGSVRFLGRRRDIPALLSAFDIGVLSSKSESFSNSLIEYMAAGLPVVTTAVGGSSEAVEEGRTGFIVPVGDPHTLGEAVLRLIADSELRAALGARGRARVERLFSHRSAVEKSEVLYASCVEARQPQRRSACREGVRG